ncbi:MAG: glutathione S-transferase [Alphaproteobacteria bacterium]|nr:glutathione S-transferase [Alphaproteobacteria bacterium]
MKLYDFEMAPNCRRVRMFMAEKGIDIPKVEVNLGEKEQLKGDYDKINPLRQVPALELDDGTVLTESTAICLYLEDQQPEPNLLGQDGLEKAKIMMWDRRMEQNGFAAVAEAVRNSVPFFKGRGLIKQVAIAEGVEKVLIVIVTVAAIHHGSRSPGLGAMQVLRFAVCDYQSGEQAETKPSHEASPCAQEVVSW